MESLAYLVVIIGMVTLFSGPFAISLTSRRLVKFLNSKESVPWAIVNVLRKIFHALTTIIGTFLGFSLMFMGGVTVAKFFGAYAIILAYIALRREYFPEFFILRKLQILLGIKGKEEPPVMSADGTEIVRAKNVKRFGSSNGRDGHGPGGQH